MRTMEQTSEILMSYYNCIRSMVDRLFAYNEQLWSKYPNRDEKLLSLIE